MDALAHASLSSPRRLIGGLRYLVCYPHGILFRFFILECLVEADVIAFHFGIDALPVEPTLAIRKSNHANDTYDHKRDGFSIHK